MKLQYYPDAARLYIVLKSVPGAASREIVDGLSVDFDANERRCRFHHQMRQGLSFRHGQPQLLSRAGTQAF